MIEKMPQKKPMQRMSEDEYMRQIENLQTVIAEGMARGESTETLNTLYADSEFDLTIDYRLGREFPFERRHELRAIHDRFEQKKESLVNELAQYHLGEEQFRKQLQGLINTMATDYAKILTPQEYHNFVGSAAGIIANEVEE